MCISKEKGGLDIRNLLTLDRALLGKWNWRFAIEEASTWGNIILLKYDSEPGGWFSNSRKGSYGVGLWKEIQKEASLVVNCSFFIYLSESTLESAFGMPRGVVNVLKHFVPFLL